MADRGWSMNVASSLEWKFGLDVSLLGVVIRRLALLIEFESRVS